MPALLFSNRPRLRLVITLIALVASGPVLRSAELAWPEITSETKPWSRWWWLGSIGTPDDLTYSMEQYAAAGLGGLEITPIYGVRGYENRFVSFLSPEWVNLFEHVLEEADRLDLGIDLATGTGWPFGGPWVGQDDASKYLAHRAYSVPSGGRLGEPFIFVQQPVVRVAGPRRVDFSELTEPVSTNRNLQALALDQVRFEKRLPLIALMAYRNDGDPVDLTTKVDAAGMLDWMAPPSTGGWRLHALFQGWHGKQVERAGPGGEGDAIDHFSSEALRRYLARFDEAFAGRDISGLRAFFNDSYEVDDAVGEANFTSRFLAEFQRRRGYDLRLHLPALFGEGAGEAASRVSSDYRETISDLLLGEFTEPWRAWAHERGAVVRNQSHGSPANLLDLYAASDIPEQEGTDVLAMKLASSAAHVTGKRLVSAEAATWINEHFLGTLGEVKAAVDQFFLGGINHVCYHGTAFSPRDDPWPGFHFYASIELNPSNPIWRDFPVLNRYVARAQSFLQAGEPDEDVLLYYNIHDRWAVRGDGALPHFHGRENEGMAAWREASRYLREAGFGFDSISDRMAAKLTFSEDRLQMESGVTYKALVLPETRIIPLETMRRILDLAEQGATVIVHRMLPIDVPGMGKLEERRHEYKALMETLTGATTDRNDEATTIEWGRGSFLIGDDLAVLLADAGVSRESMVDAGLACVRRRLPDGHVYFIVNRGAEPISSLVRLSVTAADAAIFDPMSGDAGLGALRRAPGDGLEVFLQIQPGSSAVVRTHEEKMTGPSFAYWNPGDDVLPIGDSWAVEFLAGGPALPPGFLAPEPMPWTDMGGERNKAFSGTAVYRTTFRRPAIEADGWVLSLGNVADSCRIRVNGREVSAMLDAPWRVVLSSAKLRPENSLEIEVTNLAANRIADLDRRGVPWKKFYNINMPPRLGVNRGNDGLFTAAHWKPRPSGLWGQVTLTPASLFDPGAGTIAAKPLFRDPVFDGAADPVVIWNPGVERWWMFYTNRRANFPGLSGVAWVHGTRIGIAESADGGATWDYVGTADIEVPPSISGSEPTYWAPEVVTAPDGSHHMFLTVVPGVFEDWQHPRSLVHLVSSDLRRWTYRSTLSLSSDRVIDAGIHPMPKGGWRMWYNDERDGKSIHYADSPDLGRWIDRGKVDGLGERPGEGPFVFRWKDRYWMLVDFWKGLGVFRSDDLSSWVPQPDDLLAKPGLGRDDGVNGGHPCVVVSDDRAFLFYFTHPGRSGTIGPDDEDSLERRRSVIQVVELSEKDGWLNCNRDAPTMIDLRPRDL